MVRNVLVAAEAILVATVASASVFVSGPATFTPPSPTSVDQIQATYTADGLCFTNPSTTVTGNVVRTTVTVSGCVVGPPSFTVPAHASFGPLPAATYTYEIYETNGGPPSFVSTQTLVVAAATAPVPALSRTTMLMLALMLAGLGWFVVRPAR